MIQAAMKHFESWDGIEIAYQEWGAPADSLPVLLHHGFVALGADREALVAQASAIFRGEIALDRIAARTLVLAGEADPLAIRPEVLSGAIPGARLRMLVGDHVGALLDPAFTQSIVEFFA